MWNYLLQLVCPVPGKASTAQKSLLVSFTAPVLLALAAMPSAGLDQVQPLWLQVCCLLNASDISTTRLSDSMCIIACGSLVVSQQLSMYYIYWAAALRGSRYDH